jgi:hypothetical protein
VDGVGVVAAPGGETPPDTGLRAMLIIPLTAAVARVTLVVV